MGVYFQVCSQLSIRGLPSERAAQIGAEASNLIYVVHPACGCLAKIMGIRQVYLFF